MFCLMALFHTHTHTRARARIYIFSLSLYLFPSLTMSTSHHRYCKAVRYIRERNPWFRVLALSATPGKEMVQVQHVVFNLLISKIVCRSDTDPDVKKYKFERLEEVVRVKLPPAYDNLTRRFLMVMEQPLSQLRKMRIINRCSASSVNLNTINMARDQARRRLPSGVHPENRGLIMALLSLVRLVFEIRIIIWTTLTQTHNRYKAL